MTSQSTPNQSTPTLDNDTLAMLKELMADDYVRFIETFLADTYAKLGLLQKTLDQQDQDQVRRIAHGLKGSAANLGALAFSSRCQTIEHLAKSGDLQAITGLMLPLNNEYQQLHSLLVVELA